MNIKTLKITESKKGFSMLEGLNRPIVPSHVNTLANSIKKIGITRPVIVSNMSFISGFPSKFTIDGQHLYHACIKLGIDIPYQEITIENKEDLIEKIALLNASSKSWKFQDYLLAWQSVNSEYKTLAECISNFSKIPPGQVATILSGYSVKVSLKGQKHNNTTIVSQIKSGLFTIKNKNVALKTLSFINEFIKTLPKISSLVKKIIIYEYYELIKRKGISFSNFDTIQTVKQSVSKFKAHNIENTDNKKNQQEELEEVLINTIKSL